jgi:hypothetical protein
MNDIIQPNSKVELTIIKNGEIHTKKRRIVHAIKKRVFEQAVCTRYCLMRYQIL